MTRRQTPLLRNSVFQHSIFMLLMKVNGATQKCVFRLLKARLHLTFASTSMVALNIVASMFRVSIVIEMEGPQHLGTSIWQFYDK